MFRVRQTNNKGRLNKGYWFNGNDEYLYTSFWSGNDSRTGFYHIRLTITKDTITKYYDTSNSEVLENFFNILASVLLYFKKHYIYIYIYIYIHTQHTNKQTNKH